MDLHQCTKSWYIVLHICVVFASAAVDGTCSPELTQHQVATMCQDGTTGPATNVILDTSLAAETFDITNVPLCTCRLYVSNDTNLYFNVSGSNRSCGALLMFKVRYSGQTVTAPNNCRTVSEHSTSELSVVRSDVTEMSVLKFLPFYSSLVDYCVSIHADPGSALTVYCGNDRPPRTSTAAPISVTEGDTVQYFHPGWIGVIVSSLLVVVVWFGVCFYCLCRDKCSSESYSTVTGEDRLVLDVDA